MSKHTLMPRGEQYLMTLCGEDYDHALKCVNLHDDLVEALEHMRACAGCAEGDWNNCEGGRRAEAALKKAKGK